MENVLQQQGTSMCWVYVQVQKGGVIGDYPSPLTPSLQHGIWIREKRVLITDELGRRNGGCYGMPC